MKSLAALVLFAAFAAAALAAGRWGRRSSVTIFIGVALVASFAPGLFQKDLWPFASWPLVAGIHPPEVAHPRLVAVDAAGREHDVDFRAWEPLGVDELYAWLRDPFTRLEPGERDRAAAWLLARAEAARVLAAQGERPSSRPRILGPLEAPLFLLHPPIWSDPSRVPGEPFTSLRLYMERWEIEARAAGQGTVSRELLYEGPPAGVAP